MPKDLGLVERLDLVLDSSFLADIKPNRCGWLYHSIDRVVPFVHPLKEPLRLVRQQV
jgi:hypothetical protein